MNLSESRQITVRTNDGSFQVPTHCQVERRNGKVKVHFIFQPKAAPTGIDYVIADIRNGQVTMETSKGIEFSKGQLFEQLKTWYDYIIKR